MDTLSGCRTLRLKIQEQSAVGEDPARPRRYTRGDVVPGRLRQLRRREEHDEQPDANRGAWGRQSGQRFGRSARCRAARRSRGQWAARAAAVLRRRPRRTRRGRLTEDDLADILSDFSTGHADEAMLGLDRIKPQKPHPEVAKVLETEMLEDGTATSRMHAARLLKTWGSTQNLPALKKAARDPEYHVRDCARQAIEQIGGEKPQTDDLDLLLADLKSGNLGRRMHAMRRTAQDKAARTASGGEQSTGIDSAGRRHQQHACGRGQHAQDLGNGATTCPRSKKALRDRESLVREFAQEAIKAIESDSDN